MVTEPSLPSRKRQQTRERLMDAAYQLFAEEGIHSTPIEAIAEAAGFTRGAFYSNFESKDELFFALANREWSTRLQIVREVIDVYLSGSAAQTIPIDQGVAELLAAIFSAMPDSRTWSLISREYELLALRDQRATPQYLEHVRAFHDELNEMLSGALAVVGRSFAINSHTVVDIVLQIHETAISRAILSGVDDVEAAARNTLIDTLPALMEQLTMPLHP